MGAQLENENEQIDIEKIKEAASWAGTKCLECGNTIYQAWISTTYGIILCIGCAGVHRSLGVKLSRIQDTHLGAKFDIKQLRKIQLGGNTQFKKHVKKSYPSLKEKYSSQETLRYKDYLENIVNQSLTMDINTEEEALQALAKLTGSDISPKNSQKANEDSTDTNNKDFKLSNFTMADSSLSKQKQKKKKGLSAAMKTSSDNCLSPTVVDGNNEEAFLKSGKKKMPVKKTTSENSDASTKSEDLLKTKKNEDKSKVTGKVKVLSIGLTDIPASETKEEKPETPNPDIKRLGFFFTPSD